MRKVFGIEVKDQIYRFNYDLVEELVGNAYILSNMICEHRRNNDISFNTKAAVRQDLTEEMMKRLYTELPKILKNNHARYDIFIAFLKEKLLFNTLFNEYTQIHVDILSRCEAPYEARKLFKRMKYIMDNMVTEVFLSDTGGIDD